MNIYVLQGGIGKHVMFSSLINKLSEKSGDKIAIVSAYPDLFKFHPNVEKSVVFHEAGFYDEYIKDTDNDIIFHEVYYSNYIKGKTHFIEELAKLNTVTYEDDIPDIYVDSFAMEEAERFLENFPKFIITQFSGGQSPVNFQANQPFFNNGGQIKDYPRDLAQKLIYNIREKYPDHKILNYVLPNESTNNLDETIQIEAPFLFYVCLLQYCDAYIGIDSSLQHFAANRYNNKKGVVLWGSTSPKCLGYEKNINLSNCKEHTMRPLCSPAGDIFNKDKSYWKPPDPDCMKINPDLIVEKLKECFEYNTNVELSDKHIVQNENMIDLDEKTMERLDKIEKQVKYLDQQYKMVVDAYVAAKGKKGTYNVSTSGNRLILAE
jgi:hypothetical protein